jgi:predicted DNA-binding transcriptional regulator YafY
LAYRTGYGDQLTQRHVEPIGLYFALHWHLVAFCRLRQEIRDFRLDRITDLRVLDESFAPRPETLTSYRTQQRARQPQHTLVLRFTSRGRARIRDDKYFFGWVAEREVEDGALEITLVVPSLHEVAHWLLYFGDQVHIVSPPELQQAVLALVSTAWQHYSITEQPTPPTAASR